MNIKFFATFLVTFLIVYTAVALINSGTVPWSGLFGGVVGGTIAFFLVNWWLRRRRSTRTNS